MACDWEREKPEKRRKKNMKHIKYFLDEAVQI